MIIQNKYTNGPILKWCHTTLKHIEHMADPITDNYLP